MLGWPISSLCGSDFVSAGPAEPGGRPSPFKFRPNKARMSLKTKGVDSRRADSGRSAFGVVRESESGKLLRSFWGGGVESAGTAVSPERRDRSRHFRECGNPWSPLTRGRRPRLSEPQWAAGSRRLRKSNDTKNRGNELKDLLKINGLAATCTKNELNFVHKKGKIMPKSGNLCEVRR